MWAKVKQVQRDNLLPQIIQAHHHNPNLYTQLQLMLSLVGDLPEIMEVQQLLVIKFGSRKLQMMKQIGQ